MPRTRRQVREKATEAALRLGDDYKFTRDPALAAERAKARRERRARASERSRLQAEKWGTCIVPDCSFVTQKQLPDGVEFPICFIHAAAVWEWVESMDGDPFMRDAMDAVSSRRDAIRAERKAAAKADATEARQELNRPDACGDIYFVRLNGVIKAGWSSDLYARIKSYGASAELLCHYPGTRRDETLLHQQLSPARTAGREWYEDGDIVGLFIAEALVKHGTPTLKVQWTAPRRVVGGRRNKGA